MIRYRLAEWWSDAWFGFWHRLLYKSIRIGNYRKEINRFTGKHRVYKVHPLARVGVTLSQKQVDFINQLLKDERTADAQELILEPIEEEMNFDGLTEAFIKATELLDDPHSHD